MRKWTGKRIFGNVNGCLKLPVGWKAERGFSVATTLLLAVYCVAMKSAAPAAELHAGPLFDHFELTLEKGERTEAVGPLFYSEKKQTERVWAIPPLLSYAKDPITDTEEFDLAYPLISYDRYGQQFRLHFFQLISFSGGGTQPESDRNRFTIFPIYFQQRSTDPEENYTAIGPFYGHLRNRLFRDSIFYVMFPFYSETRRRDVITDNYVYPFFHLRHGEALKGWQVFPLIGREQKAVTIRTNNFGDLETIGGHKKFFALWPFYAKEITGIGTTNQTWQEVYLPAYSSTRSLNRDITTIGWPFFSFIEDREKKYREYQGPWPFVEFARGEGKTTTRVFPFFSRSHSASLESDFYLWPIYKYNRIQADPLDRHRSRILFFVYSDIVSKNTQTGASQRRVDLWPLFSYRRDFNGNSRLQCLALLEAYLMGSHKFDRDYSPVWSIWRQEHNVQTGMASQSLLWNLYRRETGPESKNCSLLFGLFRYESNRERKSVRLLYIPIGGHRHDPTRAKVKGE